MVLGRKDTFVITIFLVFSMINYKSLKSLFFCFIIFFTISTFIHEITIFYIFHYLLIIYLRTKLNLIIKIKKIHLLVLIIFISFLLYLNLYLDNFVNVENIVNSYNYEIITVDSGAFSHLKPTLDTVLLGTLAHIKLINVAKYLLIIVLNLIPFLYFIKFKKIRDLKYLSTKNIFIIYFILSIPVYGLVLDWGRVIYINYNFFIIIIIFIFNSNLINTKYLQKKLEVISKPIKILFFIFICLSFSPKLLITDDLGSKPLYKSATKIFKIIKNFE